MKPPDTDTFARGHGGTFTGTAEEAFIVDAGQGRCASRDGKPHPEHR